MGVPIMISSGTLGLSRPWWHELQQPLLQRQHRGVPRLLSSHCWRTGVHHRCFNLLRGGRLSRLVAGTQAVVLLLANSRRARCQAPPVLGLPTWEAPCSIAPTLVGLAQGAVCSSRRGNIVAGELTMPGLGSNSGQGEGWRYLGCPCLLLVMPLPLVGAGGRR